MKRKSLVLLLTGIMILSLATSTTFGSENYEIQKQHKSTTINVSQKKVVRSKLGGTVLDKKTKSVNSSTSNRNLKGSNPFKNVLETKKLGKRHKAALKGFDTDKVAKEIKARHKTVTDEDGYIEVNKPTPGYVAYPGEQLEVDFIAYDTWTNYYTSPLTVIWDKNDEIVDYGSWPVIERDSYTHYNDTFSLSGYADGTYDLTFYNVPCDSTGEFAEDWADFPMPVVNITFTVSSSGGSSSDTGDYLEVYNPTSGYTAYSGEKLPVEFYVYDTWTSYYTTPVTAIFDEDDDVVAYDEWEIADQDCWSHYEGNILLKNFAPGRYTLGVLNVPCYSNGELVENWSDFDVPNIAVHFLVKTLQKPNINSLKVGKKKVTVSFSAVTGATKYQIYRSNSKSSGYKKIATTSSRKYVDKKAKKGKRYYYKVRAVRSKHGTIYSKYSTPKRSKKVK